MTQTLATATATLKRSSSPSPAGPSNTPAKRPRTSEATESAHDGSDDEDDGAPAEMGADGEMTQAAKEKIARKEARVCLFVRDALSCLRKPLCGVEGSFDNGLPSCRTRGSEMPFTFSLHTFRIARIAQRCLGKSTPADIYRQYGTASPPSDRETNVKPTSPISRCE